jgi:hypothetical protein
MIILRFLRRINRARQPQAGGAGAHWLSMRRDEVRLAGEHDRPRAIARRSFVKMRVTCVFTVDSERNSSAAISELDRPRPISCTTSTSRSVSSGGGEICPSSGRLTYSSRSRHNSAGASSASPAATVRTAAASVSGGGSYFSRKPETPAFNAWCTQMAAGERGDDEHGRPVGGCAVAGDRACGLDSVSAGRRSGADDLLRGSDPEFFEQVCLAPRPGHELVEVPGVKPPVRVR